MVVSILRINALTATDYTDITFSASFPLLWSFLEPAIGITVASAPIMRPLFERIFPDTVIFHKDRSQKNNGHTNFTLLEEPAYPLHHLDAQNESTVSSSGRCQPREKILANNSVDLRTMEDTLVSNPDMANGIVVKSEWSTQHSSKVQST